MYWMDHILVSLLLLALPLRILLAGRQSGHRLPSRFSYPDKLRLYYGNGLLLWLLAGLVLLVWWGAGRSWVDMGLGWGEPPYSGTAQGLIYLFAALYLLDLQLEWSKSRDAMAKRQAKQQFQDEEPSEWSSERAEDLYFRGSRLLPSKGTDLRKSKKKTPSTDSTKGSDELPAFLPTSGRQFIHYCFLALTAGVTEEIIYRGYCIAYLDWLVGSETPWQMALVLGLPAMSFGLGHLYQGRLAVAKIVLMALLFGGFYLLTGSLWVLMLLHVGVDLLGGMFGWQLSTAQAARAVEGR